MLVVGLALTMQLATLWVYVMGNKQVWAIPIVTDVSPSDESLLATLSITLQSLGKVPIYYDTLKCCSPFPDIIVTPLQQHIN